MTDMLSNSRSALLRLGANGLTVVICIALEFTANGEELISSKSMQFDGHEMAVTSVAALNDDVFTGSSDGFIRRWERDKPAESQVVINTQSNGMYLRFGYGDIRAIGLLPSGLRIACSIGIDLVSIVDVRSGKEIKRFSGTQSQLTFIARKGKLLAIKQRRESLTLYDIRAEDRPREIGKLPGSASVVHGAIDDHGRWFIGVRKDGTIWLWTLDGGGSKIGMAREFNSDQYGSVDVVSDVCTDAEGKLLAIAGVDDESHGAVDIWDVERSQYKRSYRVYDRGVIDAIALSHDGSLIAIGGDSGSVQHNHEHSPRENRFAIHIFSTSDFQELYVLPRHRETVLAICFSDDDNRLISGSADKSAIVWNLK